MRLDKIYMLRHNTKMCEINHVKNLKAIFSKSVEAVDPDMLIKNSVSVRDGNLVIKNDIYKLAKQCYIVGFGKAVLGMAMALTSILDKHVQTGIVTVPTGIFRQNSRLSVKSSIRFIEGAANNLPDTNALQGSQQIKDLVVKLQKDDILIVLISGGGSALLPLPKHPVTLSEKLELIKELAARGADIQELNCVRKCLSELKGGGLALLAYPANVISLILSDIVGDPIDYIASGPTTPNLDDESAAFKVIQKYSLYETLPHSIKIILQSHTQIPTSGVASSQKEFVHVHNYIIGNNAIAAKAALEEATTFDYQSFVLSTTVTGEVNTLSKIYAELACKVASLINTSKGSKENLKKLLQSLQETLTISEHTINELTNIDVSLLKKGICLICAGEPTVVIKGKGKGGRNQQLALDFSIEVNKLDIEQADISFLSCGTDGIDGPTDAAGAIGTLNLVNQALQNNIDPVEFLLNNDSYNFYRKFNQGDHLICTGHTSTNVMDIHLLIVAPKTSDKN